MPPKKSLTWPVNKNFGRGQLKKNGIIENEADGNNPFKKFNNKEPNIADTISILNYNDLMFVDLNDFHYINDRYTIEINVSFPHVIDFSKARNICTFGYHIKGENSGEITIGTDPTLGDSKNNIPVLGVIGKYPENTKKATPLDNAVAIISGTNTTYNFKIIYNPFEVNKFLKLSLFVNDTLNSTSEGIVNLYNFSTANRKLLLATSGYTNEPTWEGKMDLCPLEFINANFSSREMNYPSEFLSSRTDNIPTEIQAEYENASYYNNSLYISKNARSGIKYSFKSNYPSSNKKVIVYDEVNNASFVCAYTQTIGDTHYCAGIISEEFNVFSKATIVIDDLTYDTSVFPLTINGVPPIVDNKKPTDVRVKFINADDAVFKVKFEHVVDDAITSGISIPQNTYKNITLLENGQINGALPSGNGVSRGIPYKLTVFLVESDTYDPETFDLSTHPENLIIVRDIQDNLDIISFANVTNLYANYRSFAFVTDHMNNKSDYFTVYGTETGISLLDIDAPEIQITNITISGNGDKPKLSVDGYAFDERSTYDVYGLVTSIDHIYDLTEDKDKNKLQTVLFDNSNITHVLQSLSNTSSNLGVFSLNGEYAFSQFYNGYFFSDIEVDKSYHIYLMNKDSSENSENTFVQYLNNLTIPRNIITITQIVESISVQSLNANFDFTNLSDIQVAIPDDNVAFTWNTKFYEEIGTPYELIVDGISYSNYTVDNDLGTEFSIQVPISGSTSAGELSYSLYRKGMRLSPQSVAGKVFVQHSLDVIETDWVIENQPDDPNNFHNNVIVKGLTTTLLNNLIPQSLLQENTGINQDIRLGYPFSLDLTTNSGIEEYISTQVDSISSYDFSSFTQGDYNVSDLSSNNRDLLVYGNPNVDSSTKSIILDGSNDYLKYTNIGNTAGAWSHSIAFWIYVDSQILNQSSGYQETVFLIGQLDTLKSIAFKYITIDSQTVKLDYSFWYHNTEMELGSEYFDRWQHIVLTYDGQTNFKKVYHNGVLSTTTLYTFSAYGTDESSTLNLDINQPMEIGRDPRNMRYFNGKLRQFQMFNRVLTPREVYIASLYPVDGLNNAILDVPMNFSVVYNKENQTFTPTLNTIIYENLEEHSYLDMTIKVTSKAGFTKSVTKSFYTGFDSPILSISNTYMSTNNAVRIFSDVSAFDKTSTLTVYYAVFLQQHTKDELKTFFVDKERGDILLYKGENNTDHSLSISEFTKYYQTINHSTSSDMNIYNTTYYLHVYLVDDRNFDAFSVSDAMTINILANNFGTKTTTTNNTRNIYMLKHGDSVTLSWQTSYVSNSSDFTATVFGLPVTPTSTNGVNWTITKALPSTWTTNRSLTDPQFFSVSYFTTPIPFPNLICINITAPEMNITIANVSRTGNTSNSSTSITFINLDALKTDENPKGNDYSNYQFDFTATQVSTNEIKQTIINNSYPTTNAVINGLTGGNIYDIQVKVTDAAGNQYSSTVFSLQTKIPDNSSPTADLTVKTPKDPPILGYDINGYIYFTVGEIDVYAFMSDSATGYTDAQYTSLFTLYPSLKLTNYNSLDAFSNKNPTASVFDPSNLTFTQYYDGSTFINLLTERQYYVHVVAEILNLGTTMVEGIENNWFPTVHHVPKIQQTISVTSFTTTNTYNNKVGTHGDTINLLFNTAYPEIKSRIVYNLGVSDSHNVRLFNVNDDNMTWKLTYEIDSGIALKESDPTIVTEIVTQSSATVTLSGPDTPVLLDITNGLTNVVFNLGANTNYLYETDQTSILSNSVNKSVGSLVKSLFVLKEWNGLSTDTEHNNFTITVDEQCEIMIGTGFNEETRFNQAKSILKLFFNVTDADIVTHSGYGFMRESNGIMHGPATWFGCAVAPGTYSSPAGQFGDNWDWMMMGISHATATIVTETQQDGTVVETLKNATGNVINTTTKSYKYIDSVTGEEVSVLVSIDISDNLTNVFIPSLQTKSLYFEPENNYSLTTSSAINFPLTPFAISLWVKFDTTNPTDIATYLGAPTFLMPYAIDDTNSSITLRGYTTTDQTYYGDVLNTYDQTISKNEWHHICRTYIPPNNQGYGFDNMTYAWRQAYYLDGVQIYDVSYPPDRILGSESYDENYVVGTNIDRKRTASDSWTFDLYWNYTAELSRSSDDSVFRRIFSHAQISNMAVWLNTNITKNTVQMLFDAGPGYIPIPPTITAVEFKYTFEISILSADASNWIVPMHILADNIALFENSNFLTLEMLVYPQSAFPEEEDVLHLKDSDPNTYVNWKDNPQPVGTKLFNMYFKERVNNITVQYQRPTYTPGWKIYENDVVVHIDTSNHGSSLEPLPYPVTYFFNIKSVYDSATHYYPFGDKKLTDVNGGNDLVLFSMNSTRDNFEFTTDGSVPSNISYQLNQPEITIPEILDSEGNVAYTDILVDNNGNVLTLGLLHNNFQTYSELSAGYSVKKLHKEYFGPHLRIKRSTDNLEQDFTFDKDGVSSEYETWIGTATAYVTKWYDQSGNNNHGTVGATDSVTLDYTNKSLTFGSTGYFNLPDGTVPYNDDPYTLIAYHGDNINTKGSLIASGIGVNSQANLLMRWGDSAGYANYWGDNDIINGVHRPKQVVVARYNGSTRNIYNPIDGNGSEEPVAIPRSSTAIGNAIGRPVWSNSGGINWEGVVSNQPDADLSILNASANGRYGWCSALSEDGNTALISGYDYSGGGLHVWSRDTNGVWTMTGDLSLTITTQGSYGYGCALSADGKMAVVNGSYSVLYKYVYVWEKNEDGTWGVPDSSQTSGFIYNFYCVRSGDNLAGGTNGLAISHNKNVIADAGSINNNSGMLYVWERGDNNVWGVPSSTTYGGYLPNHQISIENANGYGGYGMRCVAVSEDAKFICVGCRGTTSTSGGAFIWEKGADGNYGIPDETNTTGIGPNYNLSKLTATDGQYGGSVAMSLDGQTVLILSGAGWIWKRTADGTAYGVADSASATGYSPNFKITKPYDALGFSSDIAMSYDGKAVLFTGSKNSYSGGGFIYMENDDETWSVRANLSMVSGGNGYYGKSCAISGDGSVVLVAGYGPDNKSGGAWIWEADRGAIPGLPVSIREVNWSQEVSNTPDAELARLNGTAVGQYGSWSALSGDGKTAVIAAFKATNGGGLFVWTEDTNGVWTMTDDLSYVGAWNNKGSYGIACGVSWDGQLIAVSGTYVNSQTKWLFIWEKNSDGTWGVVDNTQPSGRVATYQRLRSNGYNMYNGGSVSLAISADKRVIADGGNYGSYRGVVYIWEKVGGVWGKQSGVYMGFEPNYVLSMDTATNGYYGDSVALSGDGSIVCVGARGTTNSKGGAWLWERNADGTYGVPDANNSHGFAPNHNLSKLTDTNGYYGTSVDISFDGQVVLVTATSPGAGWIWKRNAEGTRYGVVDAASTTGFSPNLQITKPSDAIGDFGKFGHLSANGKLALISGPNDFESGGAFLFAENEENGTWSVTADLSKTSGANGRYANSSALSGDGTTALFAGYQLDNVSGSAWIWKGIDLSESVVLSTPEKENDSIGLIDGHQYWEGDMHTILIYNSALAYNDISDISDALIGNQTNTYNFLYTFEVNALSKNNTCVIDHIKVNGQVLGDWSGFYKIEAVATTNVNNTVIDNILLDDYTKLAGWDSTAVTVGTKLFKVYTTIEMTEFEIFYKDFDSSPGWKIYENDVIKLTQNISNHNLSDDATGTYTYGDGTAGTIKASDKYNLNAYKYTFEINVGSYNRTSSSNNSNLSIVMNYVLANGNFLSIWDKFVDIFGRPKRLDGNGVWNDNIRDILYDYFVEPNPSPGGGPGGKGAAWINGNANPGDLLFEIFFSEKVQSFVIDCFRPIYTPGWNIYENDILVLSENANRGSSLTPNPYPVTYYISQEGLLRDYSTTYSELSGGYSIKKLYDEYSGPQVRIKRSTDNAEQDFTFDKDGNSSAYETWIGTATAYVTKWYDQSGNNNHGTVGATNSVTLDYTNKRLTFSSTGYFNLPDGTVPYNNDPYTFVCYHGSNTNNLGSLIASGTGIDNQANVLIRFLDQGYANYWWHNDIISGVYRPDQVIVARYNGNTRNLYSPATDGNGSEVAVTTPRSSTAVGNTIGRPVSANTTQYWKGDMYTILIYKSALDYTDISGISSILK